MLKVFIMIGILIGILVLEILVLEILDKNNTISRLKEELREYKRETNFDYLQTLPFNKFCNTLNTVLRSNVNLEEWLKEEYKGE